MKPFWKPLAIAFVGGVLGLGLLVSRASAIPIPRSDQASACVGCHRMRSKSVGLKADRHQGATTCPDCHVPHGSFIQKCRFEASGGLRHLALSLLRAEPGVIRIHEAGAKVVQENCLRCHPPGVKTAPKASGTEVRKTAPPLPATSAHADPARPCGECHRETPHGRG